MRLRFARAPDLGIRGRHLRAAVIRRAFLLRIGERRKTGWDNVVAAANYVREIVTGCG